MVMSDGASFSRLRPMVPVDTMTRVMNFNAGPASLPLAALAATLLWVRLREVDREYPVAGMLDL